MSSFELRGHRSHPKVAWERLGDTDFMNRVAGNSPIQGARSEVDDAGQTRIFGSIEGPMGQALNFEELDASWVVGSFFEQRRRFDGPLIAETHYSLRLEVDGAGVVPQIELTIRPTHRLAAPLLRPNLHRIQRAWQQVLDDLPGPQDLTALPALRRLGAAALDAIDRWRADDVEVAERMAHTFRHARVSELQRLRPYALADRWSLARDQVLTAMLRGVQAGALELYWSVQCPRCYGQISANTHLSDLADHAACPSCRIDVVVDLGSSVEVVFAPHPSVVPRVEERFCTTFPAGAPRIQVALGMGPGESRALDVPLHPGHWHLGTGGDVADLAIDVRTEGRPGPIVWPPDPDPPDNAEPFAAGSLRLALRNDGPLPVRLQLTRADHQDDVVVAARLTALASFRRGMGHQVLSPSQRISVRAVTLLFTDLSGSTAMYEELGDAAAYAIVRDHFSLLEGITERHHGARVKTIGDALMAAFHSPDDGVRAAIEMLRAFRVWRDALEVGARPGLRVGLHTGPALCVHSDSSGLDYFGRSVNIAARTEGQARPDEVVISDALHDQPAVAAALAEAGVQAEAIEASLKGIAAPVRLYRLRDSTPQR